MRVSAGCEIDRIVFDSGLVRVGAFRCHPDDPSFHDSGPARNCCFVFPRTAVEIHHEHERAFVANPNVVTFYNQGQAYLRNAVCIEGDRCDWFGVEIDVVQLTLTGETAGEGFGTSPSMAGDVDHDGHADLIVGAWQYSKEAVGAGRAYLYSGKDGHLIKTLTCRIPGDTFGFDSVTMGDVDKDGTTDFLITSGWSGVHGFHSGRVFIISSGVKTN